MCTHACNAHRPLPTAAAAATATILQRKTIASLQEGQEKLLAMFLDHVATTTSSTATTTTAPTAIATTGEDLCLNADLPACPKSTDQCEYDQTCFRGECKENIKADGTGCDDKDDRTMFDQCKAGKCRGVDQATTKTTTTAIADASAIFTTGGADVQAVTGWMTTDFPAFRGKSVKLERCYSMAQSGDSVTAKGFHDSCDGKGATAVVVKSKEGHVFGGAVDKSWASYGDYTPSSAAFIFCISCAGVGKNNPPSQLKLNGQNNQSALRHYRFTGPIFGGGIDLRINGKPGASNSNLGFTYTCPAGQHHSTACDNYLAGASSFTVADYEVFVIQTK